MKVWFDCDGVISEFGSNAIRVARSLWPDFKLPPDYEPSDYGYTDLFSAKQWDAIWAEIKTIPDFWLRQMPFAASTSALRIWMNYGWGRYQDIYFITSRRSTGGVGSRPQTILWLYEQGLYPKNRQPTVICVDGAAKKIDHITELGLQFGLDDLESTVAATNLVPGHQCFLMSQPWNRSANLPRVKSVREFLDVVDRAAQSDCPDSLATPRLTQD